MTECVRGPEAARPGGIRCRNQNLLDVVQNAAASVTEAPGQVLAVGGAVAAVACRRRSLIGLNRRLGRNGADTRGHHRRVDDRRAADVAQGDGNSALPLGNTCTTCPRGAMNPEIRALTR